MFQTPFRQSATASRGSMYTVSPSPSPKASHAASRRPYSGLVIILTVLLVIAVVAIIIMLFMRRSATASVSPARRVLSPSAAVVAPAPAAAASASAAAAKPSVPPAAAVAALQATAAADMEQKTQTAKLLPSVATVAAVAGPLAAQKAAQSGNAAQTKTAATIYNAEVPEHSEAIGDMQKTTLASPLYNTNPSHAAMSHAASNYVAKVVATSCKQPGSILNRIPESAAGLSVVNVPPGKVSDLVASAQAGSQTLSVPSGYCGTGSAFGAGVVNKQNDLTNEDDDVFEEDTVGTMGGAVLGEYVDDMAHIDEPGARSDMEAWVMDGAKPIASLLKNAVTAQVFIKSNPRRMDQMPALLTKAAIPIEGDAHPGAFSSFGSYSITKNDVAAHNATLQPRT